MIFLFFRHFEKNYENDEKTGANFCTSAIMKKML